VPVKRSNIERGAIALLFPAGIVGYINHLALTGSWDGVSAFLPSVFSALLLIVILSIARVPVDERLGILSGTALVAMHIIGGATASLLGTIAWPDLPTRPELLPVLAWTQGGTILVFALTDAAALIAVGLLYRRR
jgi:hypothetical protein